MEYFRTLRNVSSLSPPSLRPPPRPPALPAGVVDHGQLLDGVGDHEQLLAGVVDHELLPAGVVNQKLLLARLGFYTTRLLA